MWIVSPYKKLNEIYLKMKSSITISPWFVYGLNMQSAFSKAVSNHWSTYSSRFLTNVLINLPLTGSLCVLAFMPLRCSVKMRNRQSRILILKTLSSPKGFCHPPLILNSLCSHPGEMSVSTNFTLLKPSMRNSNMLFFIWRRKGNMDREAEEEEFEESSWAVWPVAVVQINWVYSLNEWNSIQKLMKTNLGQPRDRYK